MDWLKQIRIEQRLLQEQVAAAAGIERAYYSMIETGKRKPSVTIAQAIAAALGFEWTRFFE